MIGLYETTTDLLRKQRSLLTTNQGGTSGTEHLVNIVNCTLVQKDAIVKYLR